MLIFYDMTQINGHSISSHRKVNVTGDSVHCVVKNPFRCLCQYLVQTFMRFCYCSKHQRVHFLLTMSILVEYITNSIEGHAFCGLW